jgi:molybdopterin synthase sulfur carrier subunit
MGGAWMKVSVKFYAHLRDQIGKKKITELYLEEGATISDLLRELILDPQIKEALLDENQKIKPEITILKNGREIKFLAGMETGLESGDEISVFPAVVGG